MNQPEDGDKKEVLWVADDSIVSQTPEQCPSLPVVGRSTLQDLLELWLRQQPQCFGARRRCPLFIAHDWGGAA